MALSKNGVVPALIGLAVLAVALVAIDLRRLLRLHEEIRDEEARCRSRHSGLREGLTA
ncbi:MAG: hypothetical protein WCC53_08225 [Thermoanaerobaculia bacterium]|jgi:hypothetical protein